MGRSIIKIKDRYFEWSSVVDAPITYGMTEDGLREYIRWQYGEQGAATLEERIERANQTGTSARGWTLEEILAGNRAGPDETCLTPDEIYERYTGDGDEPQDQNVRSLK